MKVKLGNPCLIPMAPAAAVRVGNALFHHRRRLCGTDVLLDHINS